MLFKKQSTIVEKTLESLTDHCISIFDNSYCDLPNNERNMRIMRDISGCVATLSKNHFLKSFNNLNFEHQEYLKLSNSYVTQKYNLSRFLINTTEQVFITL